MRNLFTAAALSLALAVPAFAQDAKPTTQPAQPAPAVKVQAPAPTAPAAPKVEAVKPAAPAATPKTEAAKPATPAAPTTAKADPKAAAAKLININTATAAELDALPLIGEARTKAIIAGRPYKSVDELLSKKVLPKDAFEAVKAKVSVK